MDEVTELLHAVSKGDVEARAELYDRVYNSLRKIAARRMRGERPGHTLTPTALVHEAYLKLADYEAVEWSDRAHFFAVAARAMRQILIDHALRKKTRKRGGDWMQVTLSDEAGAHSSNAQDLIDLDEALSRLERRHPRRAHVVICRFFSGLDLKETAAALDISLATVKRDWVAARAWLNHELTASK